MKKIFYFFLSFIASVLFYSCQKESKIQLYIIEVDGKYGFIDSTGQVIINPQYLFASSFHEGLALVVVDTILSENLIDYSRCQNAIDSLLVEMDSNDHSDTTITYKYGFINKKNKFVIDTIFQYSEDYSQYVKDVIKNHEMIFDNMAFYNDRALFQDKKSKKFGYINKKGKIVINPKYIDVSRFSDSLACVNFANKNKEDKWGYINIYGDIVIPGKYTYVNEFSDNLATVYLNDFDKDADIIKGENIEFSLNWFVINKKGNIVSGPYNALLYKLYDYINGYCLVKNHFFKTTLGWQFIDKNGNFTTDFLFENATYYNNGYAGVKLNGEWIFIDEKNTIVSERYEGIQPFSSGLAAVKKNGKWGYIDSTFNQVIPFKFDSCEKFHKSLAKVTIKSNPLVINGYINKKGEMVWHKESYEYKNRNNHGKISGIVTMKNGKVVIKDYKK